MGPLAKTSESHRPSAGAHIPSEIQLRTSDLLVFLFMCGHTQTGGIKADVSLRNRQTQVEKLVR